MKCASCMEVFPKTEILNATCAHAYCHVCMKQLFKNACKDEQLFPPRCCRQEIPLDVALPFLSNEDAGEFLDKIEEFTCEDRTYCFQPSCSKFISANNIICGVGSCPNCYFATCTLCKKEYHTGDCPEDPSMKLTLETAAANGWQRCQRCHAIVERSHGCQHMTCRLVFLLKLALTLSPQPTALISLLTKRLLATGATRSGVTDVELNGRNAHAVIGKLDN